jgi:hypothetical protein
VKYFITLGFSLLLLFLGISQFINKKLENIFISEIHALVKGKLQYSNFSTSFFKNFPNLSVKFSYVILLNDTSQIDTLVKLESIQIDFSPISIFSEQLSVSKMMFNNAELFLDYLEKWQIFNSTWKNSHLDLRNSSISTPYSSWIYYKKKKKISYYPDFQPIDFDSIETENHFCSDVIIRKNGHSDKTRKECFLIDFQKGNLTFTDSLGVFRREGLDSIHFYGK